MDIALLVPLASPFATPRFLEQLGARAEQCGFSALWIGEHVVVPDEWESLYPASDDGSLPDAVQKGELDAFTTLSYLAAVTETIRLGVCCNIAQRNPVYTAKEAANVDWLSGGRLEFGAGVGWSREEFDACNMPFERRGSRARSHMEVIRRLWNEPVAQYSDEFYQLRASLMYPKPFQESGIPVHCLGDSKAALRRVAEFGDGFLPMYLEPDQFEEPLNYLNELLAERGRSIEEISITALVGSNGLNVERLSRYRESGVDRILVMEFVEKLEKLTPTLEQIAERVVHPARSL